MDSFAKVNQCARDLAEKAAENLVIVNTVTSISSKTNILALEIGATVTGYSEKIKDLMEYIQQLEYLTLEFKGEIREYMI